MCSVVVAVLALDLAGNGWVAQGKTCIYQASANGCSNSSSCRAHTTAGNETCNINAACKVERKDSSHWHVENGTYLARDCSQEGNNTNTDSTSTGYAAAHEQAVDDCGHPDCVASPAYSCEDGSNSNGVRVYYNTRFDSTSHNGEPDLSTPSRWRLYDPRVRGWCVSPHLADKTLYE